MCDIKAYNFLLRPLERERTLKVAKQLKSLNLT